MSATTMVCGLCGTRFEEDRGQPACQACPLARGCKLIRCPHCGYENPVIPGWLARLQGLVGAGAAADHEGRGDVGR